MKIGIIGAGASGLMAAITAAKSNASVTVFERNDKLGRKLLVTGNGKCNFTNLNMSPEDYNDSAKEFVETAFKSFDEKAAINFFRKAGMLSKDRNGYVYPYSEQAQAVQDILIMECRKYNVRVVKSAVTEKIYSDKNNFRVVADGKEECFDRIIIACGGMAFPKSGSDGNGYKFAKDFGHKIIKPVPSLVQLKCSDKFFKDLAGVRCECSVTFKINGKKIGTESGELQFTDYGLSGIPVFQYSGKICRALDNGENCTASVDFMPAFTKNEVYEMLAVRKKSFAGKTMTEYMIGLFNWNINKVLLKRAGIGGDMKASRIDDDKIKILAGYIKSFDAAITDSNGFDRAQVTSGGVSLSQIDAHTMESVLKKGLYFAGEIMDVDGRCGGYNLQWAWTSGYIAGRSAAND